MTPQFFAAFILFIAFAYPALAQSSPGDPLDFLAPLQDSAPRQDNYDDIPIEYIKEALNFGEECSDSRVMSMYFDCRCMATRFLDERIAFGPEASKSAISQNVGPKCADGTGIAGSLYESCKADYVLVPAELDLEEFCSCYGSTYATIYENMGRKLSSNGHIRLMTQAKLTCRNPNLARRVYGDSFFFNN